jgi:pyruvate/2-oxoacid:ferredoxin oxidoreductase beta subunit
LSPKVAVAAVETNIFPLYEIVDGTDFTITHESKNLPVETYLSLQGRYKHLTEKEIQEIQRETDRLWSDLQAKAAKERL